MAFWRRSMDRPGLSDAAKQSSAFVKDQGLDVRVGIHTGECEVLQDNIGGIAVHIGARVAALAGPGETLVTDTVRDLVSGSGIEFDDAGRHELKGIPGVWSLHRTVTVPTEANS